MIEQKPKKKIRLCPRLSFLFSNSACVCISLFILTQTQWLRCRPKIKPQISRYVVVSSQTWLNWSADEIKTDSSKHVPALCFYSMTEIEAAMPKRKPNPIIIHKKETKTFSKMSDFHRLSAEWYILSFGATVRRTAHVIVVVLANCVFMWSESDITLLVRIQVSSVYFRCVVWYTRLIT